MRTIELLKRWEHPKNYMGAHWDGFYVFLGRTRDSDCLTRSNFECGLKVVKEASTITGDEDVEDNISVQVVSENHWACGWVEWIAIHETDTGAIECAESLLERLEDYPVLNEEHWGELETEEANGVWKDCFRPRERVEYIRRHRGQFDFHGFSDLMACVRGKYFSGYASELLN